MSAEAIARLRALLETPAYVDAPLGVVDLFASDLRALLDAHAALEAAHAEALDALRGVASSPGYVDLTQIDRDRVRAVLAKAGRR